MRNIDWNISPLKVMTQNERRSYWEKIHDKNYENVWSITEDTYLLDKIINTLKSFQKVFRILIIGCGSKVVLQNTLAQEIETIQEILCIDFPKVVQIASQKSNHSKIRYESFDLTDLPWENEWDVIINVNAILSESHAENSLILSKCWNSLNLNGFFLGFFPTVFCALDIANLDNNSLDVKDIDLKRSSFYEENQDAWQIFYTPLRLRKILLENKFSIVSFEVFFFDSSHAKQHSAEYYNFEDPDLMIYEHFVVLKKS